MMKKIKNIRLVSSKWSDKKSGGFTLVETLVAIFILTLAIVGSFSAAATGLQSSSYAKNQITAFYLAQDAFEYIRNIRDAEKLAEYSGRPSGFNMFWSKIASCSGGSGCAVDTTVSDSFAQCGSGCPPLFFNESSGYYGLSETAGWKKSIFTRTVKVKKNTLNDSEIDIEVTISWTQNGSVVKFVGNDSLYDWQ